MKTARIGRRLGDYQLVEQAGAGGFSVVWRARHVETDEPVAIKISRVPAFTEHLRREADLLEQVSDPQVVSLLAVNLDHEPPHLVMPWLEGADLELPSEPPEPRQILPALERTLDLVRIVGRLHEKDLVHGDLKPGNVRVDPEGQCRLLDLGLARIQVMTRQQRSLALSLVSVDGHSIAGTLDFMAPELLGGQPPTPSSDIYSIGVILHHLLTGRPPAFGINAMSLNPYLPQGIDEFLRQLLHRDPEQRGRVAAELVEPLEHYVRVERACLAERGNGHERRRKRLLRAERTRRLARALGQVVLPLLMVPLVAYWGWFTTQDGELPPWWVVLLPVVLYGAFLGVQQVNVWIVDMIEARRQERLDARRRAAWGKRG